MIRVICRSSRLTGQNYTRGRLAAQAAPAVRQTSLTLEQAFEQRPSATAQIASGTASAATTRATRRSTLVKSSNMISAASGSAARASPESANAGAAVVAGASSLLSSIMAVTWVGSTRLSMCSNVATDVPVSGV